MTTEFRFDDLDLREEPARDMTTQVHVPTNPTHTVMCSMTLLCTQQCCTTAG